MVMVLHVGQLYCGKPMEIKPMEILKNTKARRNIFNPYSSNGRKY
ncbi:MAG: hypothetical protein NZ922_00610 [Candidatus Methanomethyliaceae archaeon]|nr:hypothetical protein [Candidatus Methanomethyliaceae archaeon]MDW7970425.1 hypothetical protein [Nitrososphaerota archaeon]